jgi:hypothetical protein
MLGRCQPEPGAGKGRIPQCLPRNHCVDLTANGQDSDWMPEALCREEGASQAPPTCHYVILPAPHSCNSETARSWLLRSDTAELAGFGGFGRDVFCGGGAARILEGF